MLVDNFMLLFGTSARTSHVLHAVCMVAAKVLLWCTVCVLA